MRLYYWLVHLLFPPKCILCRRLLSDNETDLCGNCRKTAPEYPFGLLSPAESGKSGLHFLDSFTAVWYYEGDVRGSLLRYKFYGARRYAGAYGRALAMKLLSSDAADFDYLTWAPVSGRRRLRRGYDQGELLANAVGAELGTAPVRLIRKKRDTQRQSGLSSAERRGNAIGAYEVLPGFDLKGKRVLLLDDIITTGVTVDECARVLLTAGAEYVNCGAIATPRKKKQPNR